MSETHLRQVRGQVRVLPLALRHWRTDHLGWSQKVAAQRATRTEVAKAAGIKVSPSTIAMLEVGDRQPSVAVAEALAEAYGIPLAAFGERFDQPEAS